MLVYRLKPLPILSRYIKAVLYELS